MQQEQKKYPRLLAGECCLDFVNTIEPRSGEKQQDFLTNYSDIVYWCVHASLFSSFKAQQLIDQSQENCEQGWQVYNEAIVLRETLYRIFMTSIQKSLPTEQDMTTLNRYFATCQLVYQPPRFIWQWKDNVTLRCVLYPIIQSATTLLMTEEKLARVKSCPQNDGCGWLFLDTSKNNSRRYCSMSSCGNRARARRFYQQHRQTTLS